MYLLELAAQGVKGCSPTTRAPLKPGYVLLKSPGPEPLALGPLSTAILFSDGRGGDTVFLAPGARTGKVAIALYGNDLTTYRVVRELGGAGVLSRLDKTSQRFETVTQDALEMGQFLRGQAGLPGKSAFEHLFTLSAAQFPSKRGKAPKSAEPEPKKPLLQTALPVAAATDVAAAQAKLEALQRELENSQEIDQLQFQQDGLASQMFDLEAKLKGTEGLKAAVAEAEAAWASAPTPESAGLPKDIVERAQRFPQLVQKRDDALARLAGDREAEAASVAAVPTQIEPLHRDPRFLAGAGIGLLCLIAGAFLRAGSGRYLALLDIPSFGFAALVALKWVDDLQSATKVGRKGGMIAAREKKIQDDFEAEAQHVRHAQKVLGVESAEEVIQLLGRKALLAQKVEELRHQLEAAESDPDFAGAAREYERLRRESEAISRTMQEKSGGYIRDPREVERDLERTRESIKLALAGPVAQPSAPELTGSQGASGVVFEDPTPMLLSLASDLIQADLPSVAAMVKDRCAQYVAALCDKRYQAVEIDHRGNARLVTATGAMAASELPPKDLDLYYLALRLTLSEKASAKAKIPLLIDDVLHTVVDDARLPLLGRMLKHLGTLTQVVHVTEHPTLAGMADASVNL